MTRFPVARTYAAAAVFCTILGFARFSFGLLLPSIKAELPASYGTFGLVAAANFAGYLAGTLLVPWASTALGNLRRLNFIALASMAAGLLASAGAVSIAQLAVLRFSVGVSSGVAAVATVALAIENVPERWRGSTSGIVWGGGGVGLTIAALLGDSHTALPWRMQFLVMAIASLVIAAIFTMLVRPIPLLTALKGTAQSEPFPLRIAGAYACFGFGYVVYMTYVSSPATAWVLFGIGGAVGGLAWGTIFDRYRSRTVLAAVLASCATGFAFKIPLLAGICVLGTPAVVSALARQVASARAYARTLAILTAWFGAGQIVGPIVAGFAVDRLGLSVALPLTVFPLVIGAALALPDIGKRD